MQVGVILQVGLRKDEEWKWGVENFRQGSRLLRQTNPD